MMPFAGRPRLPICGGIRKFWSGHAMPRQPILQLLIALPLVAAFAATGAQAQGNTQPSANQPRPPPVIVLPNDALRGPPAPPERQIAPPRSGREIAPPMERPEPLPRMLPRVGN